MTVDSRQNSTKTASMQCGFKPEQSLWPASRTLTSATLTAVWLVSAVVLCRRISGDLTGLQSEWAACLMGAFGMGLTLVCVSQPAFLRQSRHAGTLNGGLANEYRVLVMALSALPSVILGLALLPAQSGAGVAALPVLFLICVTAAALNSVPALEAGAVTESLIDDENVENQLCGNESPVRTSTATAGELSGEEPDSHVASRSEFDLLAELPGEAPESGSSRQAGPDATQWMTRSVVDECDVMEGGFRVTLAVGQRQAAVHLPFSPAFSCVPEFECEPLDDSNVRIRTTAIHSYGVRIEASRSTNLDETECIEIGWCASAAMPERAAA
jgi:hypothetical protein